MSKRIDENVVRMEFDNQKFEKNISTTMSSLDKLQEKLQLRDGEKGFERVENKAKNVNLTPVSKAVDEVQAKFSALQVVGVTALANIANSAVNAGKKVVDALAIKPVTTGFSEYELKMNSIQTIMSGTGESVKNINKYLDDLNEYSDRTIYSFSDMTTNIGKFTNAGVKLEDAVLAIKGISNEAALSGATALQASNAMYNFSQALSSGYVKLLDWRSIETATMSTKEFRQELIDSAVAAGTLKKTGEDMYTTLGGKSLNSMKNFTDTLEQGWMTSEVLVNTLKRYTDETTDLGKKAYDASQSVRTFTQLKDTLKESAQSGWAKTWELIVGDLEQAKSLFTTIKNALDGIISGISDARNNTIANVLMSGYENLSEKVKATGVNIEDFEAIVKDTAVKDFGYNIEELTKKYGTLNNMFLKGALKDDVLYKAFEKMTSGKAVVKETTQSLEYFEKVVHRVIMGDFGTGKARVDALTKAGYDYKTVQGFVNDTLKGQKINLDKLSDSQLKSMGYTKEQIEQLKEIQNGLKNGDGISGVMSGREMLVGSIQNLITGFTNLSKIVKETWANVFDYDKEGALKGFVKIVYNITESFAKLTERSDEIKRTFSGVFSAINIVYTLIKNITNFVKKQVCKLFGLVDIDLLSITANIGDFLTYLDKFITNNASLESIGKFWVNTFEGIKGGVLGTNKYTEKLSETFSNFNILRVLLS